MIYADLHCDSLTEACIKGESLSEFSGQASVTKLLKSGCAVQCFAIFTEGKNAPADFERFAAFYDTQIAADPRLLPVQCHKDLLAAVEKGALGALLTVENMGFLKGCVSKIADLKALGVKMASLVWNNANEFAKPNLIFNGGVPDFAARESAGLTPLGKTAVEALNDAKIIIDVSHLSDGGVKDVLEISSRPVVASHSNAYSVCPVCRNLTDAQLKAIADKGGVVGINYCYDFIGEGDVFENLYRHYCRMAEVGGEDLPSLGSDFDGIPAYPQLSDCTKVEALLEYFSRRGVKQAALEKLAYKNFFRVFKEVVG